MPAMNSARIASTSACSAAESIVAGPSTAVDSSQSRLRTVLRMRHSAELASSRRSSEKSSGLR